MCRLSLSIAGVLLLCTFNVSSAQESKLYSPQPEHELLKRFAGEWQFAKLSAPSDASAPTKLGTGEIKAEMLGDFFVVCTWSGNV